MHGTFAPPSPRRDATIITLIGVAHFFSHYYIILLPPLFPVLRDYYGVSFAALGVALAILNVATTVFQAPVGFLVDRFGPRAILVAGLVLFAAGIGLVGVLPSYPGLLVLMAVAGLGNSVFHPADYAILSATVDKTRMGRAFSIHTFAGYFGFAVAPVGIVALTGLFGWQLALAVSGVIGIAVAVLIHLNGEVLDAPRAAKGAGGASHATGGAMALLTMPGIIVSFLFFILLALAHGGFTSFGPAAVATMAEVSLAEANAPLTLFLFASSAGVLVGGWLADRTRRHHLIVAFSFIVVAVAALGVALVPAAVWAFSLLYTVAGFASGVVAPSRDLLVKAITPEGASGRVFGFVTTGFNVGGIVAPLVYGFVLDLGDPRLIFWLIAGISVVTIATVVRAVGQR